MAKDIMPGTVLCANRIGVFRNMFESEIHEDCADEVTVTLVLGEVPNCPNDDPKRLHCTLPVNAATGTETCSATKSGNSNDFCSLDTLPSILIDWGVYITEPEVRCRQCIAVSDSHCEARHDDADVRARGEASMDARNTPVNATIAEDVRGATAVFDALSNNG